MPFLLDYPLEDFRNVLNTNLITVLLIKKALPAMIENGGSIINVTVGLRASRFGLGRGWAAEQESNVRVNWVDPGNMNTAMHRAAEPMKIEPVG